MIEFLSIIFLVIYKYFLIFGSPGLAVLTLGGLSVCFLVNVYVQVTQTNPLLIKMNQEKLFICLTVGLLTLISKDTTFIAPLMLAIMTCKKNPQKLFQAFFVSSLLIYGIHYIFFLEGAFESHDMIRITDEGVQTRKALGFGHPNQVLLFFIPILLSGALLIKNNLQKMGYYIVMIMVSYYLYTSTYSRTAFYLIIIFIFLEVTNFKVLNLSFVQKGFVSGLVRNAFLIFAAISLLMGFLGSNPDSSFNQLLSGRPYLFHLFLENTKLINLSGSAAIDPNLVPSNFDPTLDSMYILLITYYGIIPAGVMAYLFNRNLTIIVQKKLNLFFYVTMFFLIYGFMESNTLVPSITFIMPFLYITYFNNDYFDEMEAFFR